MRKTLCITLGALATIVVGACGQTDSALERGVEEVPPQESQVTLPPEWTPTASPLPHREPSPGASWGVPQALSPVGPWLLYCGQDGLMGLMDLDGPGRLFPGVLCLAPKEVSESAGFAVKYGNLVQFPRGEEVREGCCEMAGWSADGNLALLSDPALYGGGPVMTVYDVTADRLRRILQSDFEIMPLGLSPGGTWAVYVETDVLPNEPPARQPSRQLMAVSADGQRVRELFKVNEADVFYDRALGWLSELSLLVTRSDYPCNLVPQNRDLLHVDLSTGAVTHLFDKHSYAAFDPVTQTVLLQELPPGSCTDTNEVGRLVRLSAADGWEPHRVPVPRAWGDFWAVSQIEWHPELSQFSVRVGEKRGGAPLHLVTLDPDGTIQLEFPLDGATIVALPRLFPSPDGEWIVVGASPPHGTRLYDRAGRLVKVLVTEGESLSYGVEHVIWMPDAKAFFMSDPEGPGVFRAAEAEGWEPALVESWGVARTSLMLVQAPARPFKHACDMSSDMRVQACRQACEGRDYTRLHVGDRVVVSYEPPLSSRLRSSPAISGGVVGELEPGEQADILVGPICGDGYVWWYVEAENANSSGWAAEGNADGAWLLPIVMSGRLPTATPGRGGVVTPTPSRPGATPTPQFRPAPTGTPRP